MSAGTKIYSILKVLKDNKGDLNKFEDHSTTDIYDDGNNSRIEIFTNNIPICIFYSKKGYCKYGDRCRFTHGNICEICNKAMLVPNNIKQNKEHFLECLIKQENLIRRQDESMKEIECGICLEPIVNKGLKFGLLSHCNHKFCLNCIRSWRFSALPPQNNHSHNHHNHHHHNHHHGVNREQIQHVRKCPACRTVSYFIIPSDVYVVGDEKETIVNLYKRKLSKIPCKYMESQGYCKFAFNCMYMHANQQSLLDELIYLLNSQSLINNNETVGVVTTTTTTTDQVNEQSEEKEEEYTLNTLL